MLRALPLVLIFAAITTPAFPHTRSESQATWEINEDNVDLILTAADIEIARIGDRASSEVQIKAYFSDRIYPIADGKRCDLIPPVETLSSTTGFEKFDFTFKCGSKVNLSIHFDAFFDVVSSHVDFAQIQNIATGEFTQQLITNEHQTVTVSGDGEWLRHAAFLEFVTMGMLHIFTGVDHMCFLVGLVLISRRLRDLVSVVTGFTIGHSLTLALAVTGVLRPHAEFIDALVALTIALIGAENVVMATHRPRIVAAAVALLLGAMTTINIFGGGDLPFLLLLGAGLFSANYLLISGSVREAGRLRMVITVVFGLVHGFGFASNLLEMQLPTDRLAELLVGFNLGVEVAQLNIVLGITGLALLASRLKIAPARPMVVNSVSTALLGIGTYWFIERSFN
jgi:HupE / UreJ protein